MRFSAALLVIAVVAAPAVHAQEPSPLVLVIVVDGLRPDYVTPKLMPALHELSRQGVFFERHHAAIPTVTRVNSPSLSTGSYPETHGLMGNSIYIPSVDPDRGLNTSDYKNLLRVREAEGKLLTATTIGEVLDGAGKTFLAISSGSSGSAYLLNPESNGAGMINVDIILPQALRERVEAAVGPAPDDSMPATPRIAWTVDAYITLGLGEIHPDVTFLWMTEPDHTAHSKGMGAPQTNASLRGVDEQIARILDAHDRLGLDRRMNVLVTSDHGFSTHTGGLNLALFLSQSGFTRGVHVAGDAIYVDGRDPKRIREIVSLLRTQPTVGPIFTLSGHPDAVATSVPHTLAFELIHWAHDRSGDILVFPAWDSEVNEFGFAGRTSSGGVAGHGSVSKWDIHNTLIAAGPAFKRGLRSPVPSANPDVAPTTLRILGIDPPPSMTGRALIEAMVGGPDPSSVEIRDLAGSGQVGQGDSAVRSLEYSEVDGRRYFSWAQASPAPSPEP